MGERQSSGKCFTMQCDGNVKDAGGRKEGREGGREGEREGEVEEQTEDVSAPGMPPYV